MSDKGFLSQNDNQKNIANQKQTQRFMRPFTVAGRYVRKHKIITAVIGVILLAIIGTSVWLLTRDDDVVKVPATAVSAEYEKRLPELKKAVDSNPSDAAARKNYAVALYATGDLKGARKQYEEAVKINDRDAIAYNNLGNVYRDLGDIDKTISAYEKSIQINDKSINTYVNLANTQLYSKKDNNAAITTYKNGLKALPDNEQLQLLLGIAYEQADRVNEARQTYEAILAKNADNTAAKANLERLNKK